MKTTNLILTILMFSMLVYGYILRIEEREQNIEYKEKLLQELKTCKESNIKVYRDFHKKYAPVLREDYCKVVRKHIDKTHTPNHLTCKHFKTANDEKSK